MFLCFCLLVCFWFVFFSGPGPTKKQKKTTKSRTSNPNPPKSTEHDPLGLLKGPIGASLRFTLCTSHTRMCKGKIQNIKPEPPKVPKMTPWSSLKVRLQLHCGLCTTEPTREKSRTGTIPRTSSTAAATATHDEASTGSPSHGPDTRGPCPDLFPVNC